MDSLIEKADEELKQIDTVNQKKILLEKYNSKYKKSLYPLED